MLFIVYRHLQLVTPEHVGSALLFKTKLHVLMRLMTVISFPFMYSIDSTTALLSFQQLLFIWWINLIRYMQHVIIHYVNLMHVVYKDLRIRVVLRDIRYLPTIFTR